ncbi:MAG: D-glycero-beta-D-manno-heptose 1,7-bisphosphate 7-phosphatase [Elusimicrobia bacterium]|jgi:D-glycero-D-manno-heptose 1,7-bisphosphate phosphatase|nr:D-glycero-beta-D-manno-heptose 1,7-bisphosphate 7-phosphatase [Elusimicrobiota bacterium]
MRGPAVFLDRDGTLNVEKDYVYRYEDWEWVPGAVDGLRDLIGLGFRLVVVSNQSGIARGYFGVSDVQALHHRVAQELREKGIELAGFYFCPHGPGGGCDCRKPAPGLLLRAAQDLGIDLHRSFMVGDKASDVEAGQRAGVHPLLVETGYGKEQRSQVGSPVPVVRDFSAAVKWIVSKSKTEGDPQ